MAATSNAIRHLFLALNSYLYSFYCYPNSKASLNASPAQQSKHIILLRNATRNTVYDSLDKHWPNTVKRAYMVLSYWHGSANALNLAVGISGLEEDPAPFVPLLLRLFCFGKLGFNCVNGSFINRVEKWFGK